MYKNNKFLDYLLIRKEDSNKGTYGKTIIIGGSINYPGSIVIASSAALKCGVGYVCLGVTKSVYNRVACVNPEVIYEVLKMIILRWKSFNKMFKILLNIIWKWNCRFKKRRSFRFLVIKL